LKLTKSGVMTYGIKREADVRAEQIELRISGSHFWVTTPQGKLEIDTPLIGLHNVYNILSVIAIGVREKIGNAIIKSGVEALINVPGRLESIRCGQDFSVFVDYAHTEDALQNVLLSIKAVTSARIILVFGCGGDRDKTKRPKMGQVAGNLADVAIITNDNPRSEDPQQIAREIISGFQNQNFRLILDREEALDQAVHLAQTNDVVLVAGKGHEDYQIFKDKKVHFDDREALRKILARKLITKSL